MSEDERPPPPQITSSPLDIPDSFRPRGQTMPPDLSRTRYTERSQSSSWQECHLLRRFRVTSKGDIVNTGDFFRRKSRSNASVSSSGSNSTPRNDSPDISGPLLRRVLMLGGVGVGKTALVAQFMSSDTANAYDGSQEEDIEKSVSVLLEKTEYEIVFSDTPIPPDLPEDDETVRRTDAFVVVYSATDKGSFKKASDILRGLKKKGFSHNKAVILVGNKSDLARSREVETDEAKAVACKYNCKFIETSAGINHNVDELLVGIVSQIRLIDQNFRSREEKSPSPKPSGFLNWLLGKSEGQTKSKSCENLLVL